MSNLEIKSASGVILAATDEHDTLTAWAQSGALRGADLGGANLYGADLRGVEAVIDGGQDGRGWRVIGWLRDGQLMMSAGCRNFTLTEARAHWGGASYLEAHDAATQAEMCARVELVVAVARARGWQFEDAALAKARGEE